MFRDGCFCAAALLISLTQAAVASPPGAGVVQPLVQTWLDSPGLRLVHGARPAAVGWAPVTIRMRSPDDLDRLLALEGEGLQVKRVAGRVLVLGDVVCAQVTAAGLERLGQADWVVRIELDATPPTAPPLARTVPEVQAPLVWGLASESGRNLTGAGVVVADLDSNLDVFHPALFRADGGYYAWIDVDSDGAFQPGVDGVDLDGDGQLADGEVLTLLDVTGHGLLVDAPAVVSQPGVFEAGWDYLYLDEVGNGQRDFGPDLFFDDDDPAFGEPIFVADDVDGDGHLDLDEKLVRLGSSKVRAVYNGQHTFERGLDLSALPDHDLAWHGTCVTGILAGGTPGLTRLVGVAPDIELLFAVNAVPNLTVGGLTDRLIWAVDQGADVVLQEIALLTASHLDGSTNHERVMDEAAAAGVVMINPAGNAGGAGKHGVAQLTGGAQIAIPVSVPDLILEQRPSLFVLAVHWRSPDRDLRFSLTAPGGEQVELGSTGGRSTLADGTTQIRASRDDSDRGTAMFTIQVFGYQLGGLQPVPAGVWGLSVADDPEAAAGDPPVRLLAFASDDLSGWGRGVHFPDHEAEDHLVGFPATADSATTVAAHVGHDEPGFGLEAADVHRPLEEDWGQLRSYSSRGPRIDGASLIDVAAPDNPLAPVSRYTLPDGTAYGHGDMMVFGGTSGAGPHVAGAAALLKQLEPGLDGFEVRDRLRAAALVDPRVVADAEHPVEDLWGAGKLRIHSAVFGQEPGPNQPPVLQAPAIAAAPGQPVALALSLEDDNDPIAQLQVWWDDNYDGGWDSGPLPGDQTRQVVFDEPGRAVLKVKVVDTGGLSTTALLEVTVAPDDSPGGSGSGGCSCASGRARGGWVPWLLLAGLIFRLRNQPSGRSTGVPDSAER